MNVDECVYCGLYGCGHSSTYSEDLDGEIEGPVKDALEAAWLALTAADMEIRLAYKDRDYTPSAVQENLDLIAKAISSIEGLV